ncbi:MAG: hypothetical protein HC859_11670, partial [Bacteroidia bacterium]|nr:hypothetical protein [Bacteroidia bacterium]
MTVDIAGERLDLLPQRAAYWPAKNVLLLADMHLGKVNHFRKAGIPVPTKANDKNIEMFIELLQRTAAQRVICLGDLFHSHYNPEWEVFGQVIEHFSSVCFELVIGNHDIMSQRFSGHLARHPAFLALLDHPAVIDVVTELCGPTVRLDHAYGIVMDPGNVGLDLHGGGHAWDPAQYYTVDRHGIHTGLVAVQWAISGSRP